MSRWLVNNLPSWLLLLGIIVAITGAAMLIQRFVRRRYPQLRGEEHNDVTRFAFGVVGFVFAFFIGFVVSAMWGQINDADGRARSEGTAGVQLARDAAVFDDADRKRIRTSLLDYEHAAVTEWGEVANGRTYPQADEALSRLNAAYDQVQAKTDAQKARLAASYSNLDALSKARAERTFQARTDIGPPWSLWAVIFLTSGLLLGGAIIYGVERPATHYTMVAILGVLVGAQLFLVLELSHPFIGEIATSPEPLREVIHVLTTAPAASKR
ncbi:DUF4239 domain-containing protein [Mycobacterium sp. 3519A]|uniref:bestrophin-like domain n=1 Tax=Mycobacterium sp. 3519A TaxID=2057184 RepID=UPI001F304B32|nr:DUF4239 domain-containing protein [Mycobacterium sp. 3519A]